MRTTRAPCPECGQPGRPVGAETIEALLRPSASAALTTLDGFSFCRTPECETAYYRPGGRLLCDEVQVPIFQKQRLPTTPVCYCFGHTVGDIEAEVKRSGNSAAPGAITEACRQGLDRCETENPQGCCCLGNVREVLHAAQETRMAPHQLSTHADGLDSNR